MRYQTFRLQVGQALQGELAVYAYTPRGEGRTSFRLPAEEEWNELRVFRQQRRQRDVGRRHRDVEDSDRQLRSLGELLFSMLFSGEVLGLYERSLDAVAANGEAGLRIELMFDPRDPFFSKLQAVPWELMRQPGAPEFLALNRRLPIVRYLTFPRAAEQGWRSPPIRIVAVGCSPRSMEPLDLERELQNLMAAASSSSQLEIVRPAAPTLSALRRVCLERPCHVLHFMGHGGVALQGDQPALFFETEKGETDPVSGVDLANKLADFPSLKLVFLNACETASLADEESADAFAGVASALVLGGMPAVVAMHFVISDDSAITFSRSFYERLAAGDPLEAAVAEGRQAIHSADPTRAEWATPLLFLRGVESAAAGTPKSGWRARMAIALLGVLLLLPGIGLYRQHRAAATLELNNRGFEELARGELGRARGYFEEALAEDPDYAPAHANLSLLEAKSGNEKAAVEHARAAVMAQPGEAFYQYNLGYLLALSKRSEDALECLQRAIEMDPDYAEAYNEMGNSYLDLDRPAEAEAALARGLLAKPGLPDLSKNLGRALLAQGKAREAILRLDAALLLYQQADSTLKAAETLWWLAAAHAEARDRGEACRKIEELRQIDGVEKLPWLPDADRLARQLECQGLPDR